MSNSMASRVRMTFEFLTDAKTMFELLLKNLESVRTLSMTLTVAGMPDNSRTMEGARQDARFILGSLLAVSDEIIRLHDQCADPDCKYKTDREHIVSHHMDAETEIMKILRAIEEDDRRVEGMPMIDQDEELTILARLAIRGLGE